MHKTNFQKDTESKNSISSKHAFNPEAFLFAQIIFNNPDAVSL